MRRRRRRRREKVYNVVSFTLPVPAMSHGHRGGDRVAVVEVTPHSTHPHGHIHWCQQPWHGSHVDLGRQKTFITALCWKLHSAPGAQGISTVSTGRKEAPSPWDAFKFSRGAKQGHLHLFLAPLSYPRHCCSSEELLLTHRRFGEDPARAEIFKCLAVLRQ